MKSLIPSPPFLWPETRALVGGQEYTERPPFQTCLAEADCLAGLVLDLNGLGIDWLAGGFLQRSDITCSLLVAVYPACPTRKEHLLRLLELMERCSGREFSVEFRILPVELLGNKEHRRATLPPSALQIQNTKSGESHLAVGSCGNFGQEDWPLAALNFVFRAEAALLDAWRKWFDLAWTRSARLTQATCDIPHLVPAEGEFEAVRLWREFEATCSGGVRFAQVDVNPDTGEVVAHTTDGGQAMLPTDLDRTPRLDPLAAKLAALYEKGSLITVDKSSRIPPLDAPIDPRLFGENAIEERGAVQRKVQYRVSALDEKDLKTIEDLRKGATRLLDYFSFSLADGARWMPDRARPLFEKVLLQLNERGLSHLRSMVGNDVASFVRAKKQKIEADAREMYQRINPGKPLPADVLTRIMQEIQKRFEHVLTGSLVPKFNFNRISFPSNSSSDSRGIWGQGCSLLTDMALLMREPFAGDFFSRGMPIPISIGELLQTLDILGDKARAKFIVSQRSPEALAEVKLIKRISGSAADLRTKCELLMKLMEGAAVSELEKQTAEPS